MRANPLADVADNPKRYQVSFCDGEPDGAAVEQIAAAAAPSRRGSWRSAASCTPGIRTGVGRSKMWNKLAGQGAGRPRHRAQLDDGRPRCSRWPRARRPRAARYTVADVFTDVPLQGNQVAVFTDAAGLSDEIMQRAAREMNLSETVFVFARLRRERTCACGSSRRRPSFPFAGHPVLGTAFVSAPGDGVERGPARDRPRRRRR